MQESLPEKRFLVRGSSLTLHATRPTPHGATRLVQAMSAWPAKTRRAPSRHCRHARVYVHTTTVMHDMNNPREPPEFAGNACWRHADLYIHPIWAWTSCRSRGGECYDDEWCCRIINTSDPWSQNSLQKASRWNKTKKKGTKTTRAHLRSTSTQGNGTKKLWYGIPSITYHLQHIHGTYIQPGKWINTQ